jgi:microsomal dipeptidase-like Zn-dependent dipeptidase
MGIEHVGLGGDFTARLVAQLPAEPSTAGSLLPAGMDLGAALEGLAGPEAYPALEAALCERGWREDDITAVMDGNVIRFLRRALPD